MEEQVKHFGGLEEKTMFYLRTYLSLRGGGREGDACGDGSHAGYHQQKQRLAHGWWWPQCLASTQAFPEDLRRRLLGPLVPFHSALWSHLMPLRHLCLCLHKPLPRCPVRRLSGRRKYPLLALLLFQLCSAVFLSWECTVQLSQGDSFFYQRPLSQRGKSIKRPTKNGQTYLLLD